jgi:predicted HTH transcriptional regulator
MTRQVLIDNVVRQTTVLIAQLATSGGVRSPLARIADQVFLDLARELDAQGISRKVSADMFGLALRSYRRRVRQLSESSTERGRTLWEAVLAHLSQGRLVTRSEVLKRFDRDEEALVKGVLNDLCESGLVFRTGVAKGAAYRAATQEELADLSRRSDGLLELVWMLVYREGPITEDELARRISLERETLGKSLRELVASGRARELEDGRYDAGKLVLPLG